ncbi:MAG TPA: helix-turn-helix transcriptional regulator, partial [Candidatus Paceibacterota bacterium]|nr:helix-turn-helix transcriptional regulator [Candidatus Paceibacterota bacterium]
RTGRKLTPREQARLNALAEKIDGEEKEEIIALGRKYKVEHDAEVREQVQQALSKLESMGLILRKQRESKGYSLEELARRAGMHKPAVSKLETDPGANPTVETLARYAAALGKRIEIRILDQKPRKAKKKTRTNP